MSGVKGGRSQCQQKTYCPDPCQPQVLCKDPCQPQVVCKDPCQPQVVCKDPCQPQVVCKDPCQHTICHDPCQPAQHFHCQTVHCTQKVHYDPCHSCHPWQFHGKH
ncbi:small proline-rich protein 2H-like [Xenopus laevis]|uniref:Small proline-rich protein 2H-like n=1 Tax=Xenopus laevis TaxID=8355 RepID=A0A8J1L5P3_XENLA|nr:small proline-rich protein 2H-like [Xenopus laevis]